MDFGIYAGDTSKTIYVFLQDSTTGLAKTGIAYNSAGAIASYNLPLAARSAITLATQTVTGAWSSGGFVEVDATNEPGIYRFDVPNAAIASGSYTVITLAFTGVKTCAVLIPLHVRSVNVTQWLGTAAATPTVAGVPEVDVTHINGSAASGSGTPDVNVVSISGDTVAADNAELFFDGTGYTTADLTEILDRLGFLLAREAGAVPDAQTTAPVYTITRSGDTYTVTLAGCTSAGVRTAPTLGKS